jgi:hypothetical protein
MSNTGQWGGVLCGVSQLWEWQQGRSCHGCGQQHMRQLGNPCSLPS